MGKAHTKKFFELIMDNLPFGVAVNQISSGDVLYVNESMRAIYELDKDPKSPDEFFDVAYKDPEFREEIRKQVMEDIASCDPKRMVWEYVPMFVEGEPEKYITAVNIPLYDLDLMISTVKDVTSEVKAQEALEESETQLMHAQKMEAIGRLAANVAHDFNNLVGIIKSSCFLISTKVSGEIKEKIEVIEKAADSAEKLTYQLNVFGRKHKTELETIELSKTLAEFEELLERLVDENIKLSIKCDEGLENILIDKNQLQQALINLVMNSVDALPDGGNIFIRAKSEIVKRNEIIRGTNIPPGSYVVISVLDNGIGMDAEVMQHIFEPFYTTKEGGKGTGLGLSIVYGFVKKSSGHIYCNSIVNEGSIFEIYFPVHN